MHTEHARRQFDFKIKPHILVIEAPFHRDIADLLRAGALAVLEQAQATYEIIDVPGALEIPAAVGYAVKAMDFDPTRRRFDGYVALGCVIKGDTMHDEIVGIESARGLQDAALRHTLAIGNGILTCNNRDQALVRARRDGQDRGGAAAEACLRMIEIKQEFHLTTKRRWVARS